MKVLEVDAIFLKALFEFWLHESKKGLMLESRCFRQTCSSASQTANIYTVDAGQRGVLSHLSGVWCGGAP
jgi:hypothetical protein